MKRIAIVGCGFTGTMAAVQVIEQSPVPCTIILIDNGDSLNKGTAFQPYSDTHLLNVATSRMSAYPGQPEHFLEWVLQRPDCSGRERAEVAGDFLPRRLYGEYLVHVWNDALRMAESRNIDVVMENGRVTDLDIMDAGVYLRLDNGTTVHADYGVLATGNNTPGNPEIRNHAFYRSHNYFRNPWHRDSIEHIRSNESILIIGSGLTMVDTVFGILERGYQGEIHSVSPYGFTILPHQQSDRTYTALTEELGDTVRLRELVTLVNAHITLARKQGLTAGHVVDALRPHTQRLWRAFSIAERRTFVVRVQHLWNSARHRIPMASYERIQQLQADGTLHIHPGRIVDIVEHEHMITVEYRPRRENATAFLDVSRVINCTGPETNVMKMDENVLRKSMQKGILTQDALKLGIAADTETFQVLDAAGNPQPNLYTIGPNLKGELWESTAVNELRMQAERLAGILVGR